MEDIIDSLKSSTEYNQYISVLSEIKRAPELYNRVAEFRKRSMEISIREDVDFIKENENLQSEFADLLINELVIDYMSSEMRYVKKVRKLRDRLLEGANIDISMIE
jgi:hypothetical protein